MGPLVFVADDAFPLQYHSMKPFLHQEQTRDERIFSYRLSRARRTVESAFGMLANKFRIFLSPINLSPTKVETLVLATCALHNFLRRDQPPKPYNLKGHQGLQSCHSCKVCKGEDGKPALRPNKCEASISSTLMKKVQCLGRMR